MTRILTDGAELGTFNDNLWVGTGLVVTTPVRSGSYAYNCAGVFFQANRYMYTTFSPKSELYVRFAFRHTASQLANRFIQLRNNTTEIFGLGLVGASGSTLLTLYIGGANSGSSTSIISVNTYYLVELYFKIDSTNGIVKVKINNNLEINYSGNTMVSGKTVANILYLYTLANAHDLGQTYFDDIAINDTNGEEDNSWCKDGRVACHLVNGNGTVIQLTPSTGSMPNWELVNELPPNEANYVSGSLVNKYDLYTVQNSIYPTLVPKRLWIQAQSINNLGNENGNVLLGIREENGTEDWGENIPISASYSNQIGKDYKLTPSGSNPFSLSDINNLQIGIKAGV